MTKPESVNAQVNPYFTYLQFNEQYFPRKEENYDKSWQVTKVCVAAGRVFADLGRAIANFFIGAANLCIWVKRTLCCLSNQEDRSDQKVDLDSPRKDPTIAEIETDKTPYVNPKHSQTFGTTDVETPVIFPASGNPPASPISTASNRPLNSVEQAFGDDSIFPALSEDDVGYVGPSQPQPFNVHGAGHDVASSPIFAEDFSQDALDFQAQLDLLNLAAFANQPGFSGSPVHSVASGSPLPSTIDGTENNFADTSNRTDAAVQGAVFKSPSSPTGSLFNEVNMQPDEHALTLTELTAVSSSPAPSEQDAEDLPVEFSSAAPSGAGVVTPTLKQASPAGHSNAQSPLSASIQVEQTTDLPTAPSPASSPIAEAAKNDESTSSVDLTALTGTPGTTAAVELTRAASPSPSSTSSVKSTASVFSQSSGIFTIGSQAAPAAPQAGNDVASTVVDDETSEFEPASSLVKQAQLDTAPQSSDVVIEDAQDEDERPSTPTNLQLSLWNRLSPLATSPHANAASVSECRIIVDEVVDVDPLDVPMDDGVIASGRLDPAQYGDVFDDLMPSDDESDEAKEA